MDAVVKIIKNGKNVKIDIETFTNLGKVHTLNGVYLSLLQASWDVPDLSFVITDVDDRYYEAIISSLEKRLKTLKGHFPSIEIEFEHDIDKK